MPAGTGVGQTESYKLGARRVATESGSVRKGELHGSRWWLKSEERTSDIMYEKGKLM